MGSNREATRKKQALLEMSFVGAGTDGFEATDFQKKVALHAEYYTKVANSLRLTDFNPLTVDWTDPVAWGNDPDTCKSDDMSDDSGCMMPLVAGVCVRPPPRNPTCPA